jgi:hypothetical protein
MALEAERNSSRPKIYAYSEVQHLTELDIDIHPLLVHSAAQAKLLER